MPERDAPKRPGRRARRGILRNSARRREHPRLPVRAGPRQVSDAVMRSILPSALEVRPERRQRPPRASSAKYANPAPGRTGRPAAPSPATPSAASTSAAARTAPLSGRAEHPAERDRRPRHVRARRERYRCRSRARSRRAAAVREYERGAKGRMAGERQLSAGVKMRSGVPALLGRQHEYRLGEPISRASPCIVWSSRPRPSVKTASWLPVSGRSVKTSASTKRNEHDTQPTPAYIGAMLLFLVRHAQAAPGDPDELRTLTAAAGTRRARSASASPRSTPDLVLSSPLLRARETAARSRAAARRCASTSGWRRARPRTTSSPPSPARRPVVAVGHQPDCCEIALALGGGEPAFPPAAVAELELA